MRRFRNNFICLGLSVLLISGMLACTSTTRIRTAVEAVSVPGAEYRAWEEGVRAFEQGDYRKAAGLFEMLSEAGHASEIPRKALFALAATRLVLAQTPEDYASALEVWKKWSIQYDGAVSGEDARMLTPFLVRFSSMALVPDKISETPLVQPRKVAKDSAAGSPNYKSMLQSKDKELESLRGRLDSREREVRRLRHQLESLEEIHRKYQEKKQEASTP